MTEHPERTSRFLTLHQGEQPLLLPNPWDPGSALLLASLGFQALATTSSGFAATLGRLDGSVTREEALEHAAQIAQATDLPVTADLENGFADEPAGAAETVRLAAGAGLAGCSVEDFSGRADAPIYDPSLAAARVEAAAEAAHRGSTRLVLTARAENYLRGRPTWPTRSTASRPTRRAAPMCSMGPASPAWRTSASWSHRSTGRSTSWPGRGPAVGRTRRGRGQAGVGRRRVCLRRPRGDGRGGQGAG